MHKMKALVFASIAGLLLLGVAVLGAPVGPGDEPNGEGGRTPQSAPTQEANEENSIDGMRVRACVCVCVCL